jgi:hypothetical protein
LLIESVVKLHNPNPLFLCSFFPDKKLIELMNIPWSLAIVYKKKIHRMENNFHVEAQQVGVNINT